MNSRRPGRRLMSGVTVSGMLVAGAAGLMLVGCGIVDTSHAELAPLRRGVVAEICAGQTIKQNPGDAALIRRQTTEVIQQTATEWGVDLGSWLAGRAAVGTSPACRDARGGPARVPVGQGQSRR